MATEKMRILDYEFMSQDELEEMIQSAESLEDAIALREILDRGQNLEPWMTEEIQEKISQIEHDYAPDWREVGVSDDDEAYRQYDGIKRRS